MQEKCSDFLALGLAADGADGYGMPPTIPQYPHCDARMLHAPGECEYCDDHPDWQELRQTWAIAFTDHVPVGDQTPCPFNSARPAGSTWPGNQRWNGQLVGTKRSMTSTLRSATASFQGLLESLTQAEKAELLEWAKDVMEP